nr:F-box/LRR-repeat protein 3-like isoform X2 [Ipomoea batatas]
MQEDNPKSSTQFESLTEEIIFSILDCLDTDPESKKSFSQACRSFFAIESRHRRVLRPLNTNLIAKSLQRYPFVSHLDFTLCPRVDDEVLVSISNSCKAAIIRSVDLSRSRFFSNVGLSSLVLRCPGLVEINLCNATELTDSAAAAIAEAKNLEKLWLGRCKLISDIGIGCIAVGCKKLRLLSLKWCVRVGDLGVGLIAIKCKEIRSLDLSYLPITEMCLLPILQLQHLKELILVGCPGLDDDGLASLKQGSNSLEILNVSCCQNISHVGLSSLSNSISSLRQLNLSYGSYVTADLAKSLQHFSQLQSIRLDGCTVTCSGMESIADWVPSLRDLSLCKCTGVTDKNLSCIIQKHGQLQKLDITCCRKITCASIESITESCTSLVSLRMESCSLVSKEAFVLIGQRCRSLEDLDITDNDISDEGLISVSGCCNLSSLKLGLCMNITDYGLSQIGKCSKLKELDLYRCVGITDEGIAAIAEGCQALEMINMAYCEKVTDNSLISLSRCTRLRTLEIRGCPRVSSVGLSSVAAGCKKLEKLDIKKCHNIDNTGMVSLVQCLHSIKQINLSYCSVTDIGLVALASMKRVQEITILHVNGISREGLAASLMAFRGVTKVKLNSFFRPLLPEAISHVEAQGCIFHWRNKPF